MNYHYYATPSFIGQAVAIFQCFVGLILYLFDLKSTLWRWVFGSSFGCSIVILCVAIKCDYKHFDRKWKGKTRRMNRIRNDIEVKILKLENEILRLRIDVAQLRLRNQSNNRLQNEINNIDNKIIKLEHKQEALHLELRSLINPSWFAQYWRHLTIGTWF